jgi:hypothetical protein
MKRTNIRAFATALVVAVLIGMSQLVNAAEASVVLGRSLATLAGNWAGEGSATFAICYNADFSAVEDCSTAANNAFFNQTFVFHSTTDKKGNSCSTLTITNGPEFPAVPASPANAFTFIQTGVTTSYNPATQSGVGSYTSYNANSDTFCNGSVLVNTGNAAAVSSGTGSIVVSQKGALIDGVTLTSENSPISDLADFVGHSVEFKQ